MTDQELRDLVAENARWFKLMQEDTRKLKEQMKQTQKELWGIWNSQEEVWVDLFRRNMKWILRKRGINIDETETKFKSSIKLDNGKIIRWEYDLMGINWKDIVVVEVKNKLRNEDINKFITKQLPNFKTLFPSYKDYNLYGWVWSLIVSEDQEKQAERAWLFVFTQWADWNAMIMNKDNFKAKVF